MLLPGRSMAGGVLVSLEFKLVVIAQSPIRIERLNAVVNISSRRFLEFIKAVKTDTRKQSLVCCFSFSF